MLFDKFLKYIPKFKLLMVVWFTFITCNWFSLNAQTNDAVNIDLVLNQVLSYQNSIPPYALCLKVRMPFKNHSQGYDAEIYDYVLRCDGPKYDIITKRYNEIEDSIIPTWSNRSLWNGTQHQARNTWIKSGTVSMAISSKQPDKNEIWSSPYLGGPLSGYLLNNNNIISVLKESDSAIIHTQMEDIEGFLCYKIEGYAQKSHYQVWIDPNFGYNIRKLVSTGPPPIEGADFILKCELDNVKINKIDDHYIVTEGKFTSGSGKDKDSIKILQTWEYKKSNIQLNPDFVKLGAFVMDAPDGTKITHDDYPGIQYQWQNGKAVAYVGDEFIDLLDNQINDIKANDTNINENQFDSNSIPVSTEAYHEKMGDLDNRTNHVSKASSIILCTVVFVLGLIVVLGLMKNKSA